MERHIKLYMVMLGCTPKGRLTEQHDILNWYFVKDLVRNEGFWPEAKGKFTLTGAKSHLLII
jgi:hypothetical protein